MYKFFFLFIYNYFAFHASKVAFLVFNAYIVNKVHLQQNVYKIIYLVNYYFLSYISTLFVNEECFLKIKIKIQPSTVYHRHSMNAVFCTTYM